MVLKIITKCPKGTEGFGFGKTGTFSRAVYSGYKTFHIGKWFVRLWELPKK